MSVRDEIVVALEKLLTVGKCVQFGSRRGSRAGTRLLLHGLMPTGRRMTIPIPMDTRNRALVIRAGTSDYAAFVTCIVESVYRVPPTHAVYAAEWLSRIEAVGSRPLVVDAGANIGASAAMLALEWPSALVVAVEPAPENAVLLRANMAQFPSVEVLPEALAAQDGWVSLTPGAGGFDGFQTSAASSGVRIRARSITSLLAAYQASPFLLKVDVEGAESEVFCDESVWEFPVIALETHDWLFPFGKRLEPFLAGHIRNGRDLLVADASVVFSIAQPPTRP